MKRELWLRLRHYHFDHLVPPHLTDRIVASFGGSDASTRAFANKLGRKLGWRTPFALRAIAEYKKFVYLGIAADFSVTPPMVIDKVWHEHLLFSRAYREFCRDVLGRDFDHNPELVPLEAQTDVFHAQYDATLALYESEFHVAPPADIWGTPKFGARDRQPGVVPRRASDDTSADGRGDDTPLYMLFTSADGGSSDGMAEFGGGGGFSGGGGGSSWGDSHGADSDAGGGSGDSGGGDGGSSCSSSCGGGD